MKRRTFLTTSTLAAAGLVFAYKVNQRESRLTDTARVSDRLEADFQKLLGWLKTNGWTDYLNEKLNVNMELPQPERNRELVKQLDKTKLASLRSDISGG